MDEKIRAAIRRNFEYHTRDDTMTPRETFVAMAGYFMALLDMGYITPAEFKRACADAMIWRINAGFEK